YNLLVQGCGVCVYAPLQPAGTELWCVCICSTTTCWYRAVVCVYLLQPAGTGLWCVCICSTTTCWYRAVVCVYMLYYNLLVQGCGVCLYALLQPAGTGLWCVCVC